MAIADLTYASVPGFDLNVNPDWQGYRYQHGGRCLF